jgi:hypothetical protein
MPLIAALFVDDMKNFYFLGQQEEKICRNFQFACEKYYLRCRKREHARKIKNGKRNKLILMDECANCKRGRVTTIGH